MTSSGPFDADAIIVGSGFGGSVSALRLAEKGHKVLVLEKGKRWRPDDFPRTNWNVPKAFWLPALGCHGTFALHLLRDVLVVHGVGVGGGSLVYANTHLTPKDGVWDDPQWKGLEDWHGEMPGWYQVARRMLGSTTNPQLGPADDALRRAAERRGLGASFKPTQVGVYFGEPGVTVPDPYFEGKGPARTGCTFCGACMTGCRPGAKNTLDKNYLYLAEKAGARVVAETKVQRVEPLAGGGYRVLWRNLSGQDGSCTAPRVVLAAGVLGTVPLLIDCKAQGTLPALAPALGSFARTNSEAILGVTSRSRRDLWKGIAITSSADLDEFTHMEPVRYTKGADVMLGLGTLLTDGGGSVPRPLRWLGQVARHPLRLLFVSRPWGKAERSTILLVMQTRDSHMTLVKRRTWYSPFRPVLTSRATAGQPAIPSYIPLANQVARELADDLDAVPQSTLNEALLDVSTTAHILGGCAIGRGPDSGVVSSRCEVFGYPGLYVMDGSIVGANLGVNPSLTITALSEMACSRIAAKGA